MIINVFDRTLSYLGAVDDFSSCIMNRKYRGTETLELTIRLEAPNATLLAMHNWLYAGPRRVFEVLHREINGDNPRILKVIAYSGSALLSRRITMPPAGQAYHEVSGSRDAIVKAYIAANLITPIDPSRAVPHFKCASIQGGTSISDQTRLKNLSDEVNRVLAAGDLGYLCDLDLNTRNIVFDTYVGVDRTAGNVGGNPPSIFSMEYDNILSQSYTESLTNAQNVSYVGGQGEGEDRTIEVVGSASGLDRFEAFQDARDTNDAGELAGRGLSKQSDGTLALETKINPYGNLVYDADYALGDLVTVQDRSLGLTMDNRITEVKEIYQKGQPFGLDVVFGTAYPEIVDTVKTQQSQLQQLSTQEAARSSDIPQPPQPYDTTPSALGTAAPGSSPAYARGDHVHSSATIPQPYASNPAALGTASAGNSVNYSRGDHVHPTTGLALSTHMHLSRAADYTWTLGADSTTIINQNITIGDNELYYFEFWAMANAAGTCDMYLEFNGTAKGTSNYDSAYLYGASIANDSNLFNWTTSASKPGVICGYIKKINGYICAWGQGLRGGTVNTQSFYIRKLAAGNVSSIKVSAGATVNAGATMKLWKV